MEHTNSPNTIVNHISFDTLIEGDIQSKTDIQINSTLKGSVRCDGIVTIESEGKVEGNVMALNTLVRGTVMGNVKSKSHTYIQSSGKVKGSIETQKLILEHGAHYNKVLLKSNVSS